MAWDLIIPSFINHILSAYSATVKALSYTTLDKHDIIQVLTSELQALYSRDCKMGIIMPLCGFADAK